MCIGDFNDFLLYSEKQDGRLKEKRKVESFAKIVNVCQLNDAMFQRQQFTWFGVREGVMIKERLDRAFVNLKWQEKFPKMQVFNLQAVGSDHSPIVVDTEYNDKKTQKAFRFEVGWVDYEECERMIREGWKV